MKLFEHSKYFKELIKSVTRRLGLKRKLKRKQIIVMWNECRLQQAFHLDSLSPWCAVGISSVKSCHVFHVYCKIYDKYFSINLCKNDITLLNYQRSKNRTTPTLYLLHLGVYIK